MRARTLKFINPRLSQLATELAELTVSKKPRLSKAVEASVIAYTIAKLPKVKSTKSELKAIKEGQEEFERGEFIKLEDWRNEVASNSSKQGKKTSW